MRSQQNNESNSIDANDDWGVQRINGNIIFILVYTFSRHFYETSFVLRCFFNFMKISSKHNLNIWVEFLNFILVLFPFVNYDQIYKKKTPTLILITMKWRFWGFIYLYSTILNNNAKGVSRVYATLT